MPEIGPSLFFLLFPFPKDREDKTMERKDNQRSLAVGKEKTRRTLACERDDRRMDSWNVFAIRLLLPEKEKEESKPTITSFLSLWGHLDEMKSNSSAGLQTLEHQ